MSKRRCSNQKEEEPKIRRTSADGEHDSDRTNSSSSPMAGPSERSTGAGQGEPGFGVTLQPQCDVTLNNIDSYVERCKGILARISQFLNEHPQLCDQTKLDNWRKDLSELQEKTSLPKTVIAVVGATGCGKSSLVNALVDHDKLLPTSGMSACTAVPVEVTANATQRYEADIEFLSREEWSAELVLLKNRLTSQDGTIKYSRTKASPDVIAALSKVTGVYGPLEWKADWNKYTEENNVTRSLSKTVHVSETEAETFRWEIDKYIKSRVEEEDQYWPIVRHVRIKIPKCDVCNNGAIIVDLPGIGDSNPARNNISENFQKNCHAMFVAADITRAVDDEAAKNLLGPRFRQKLLLDGQYDNVSFICTQTDQVDNDEVISDLHLANRLKRISDKKKERQECIENLKSQERTLETRIKEEIQGAEIGDIQDENQINEIHQKELERIKKEIEIQKKEKKELQMEEKVICIRARNEFCTRRIKKDFIAGLMETRLDANKQNEEDDDEDEDDISDGEDEEPINTSLRVFCVSAKQYLKMTGNHDEEEQIFKDAQDTQIPQLKKFVKNISSEQQNQAAVSLLRSIRILARDICHQTEASAGEHMHMQNKANTDTQIEKLHTKLKQTLNDMMNKIREKFDGLIRKLNQGAGLAVIEADGTQRKWGSRPGGYSWNTYQTTCQGNGFYRPRKKPEIDFNGDLAEPMYSSIKGAWDDTFNQQLERYLGDYLNTFVSLLITFAEDLSKAVKLPGTAEHVTYLNCVIQRCARSDKLLDSVDNVRRLIKQRQRTIHPILIEKVKEHMQPAYNSCKIEVGKGMFERMKTNMTNIIDENKNLMFYEAQVAMTAELKALVDKISCCLQDCLEVLLEDLRHQSWWETSSDTHIVSEYETEARSIKEEIEQICTEARISEHLLPAVSFSEAGLVASCSLPQKEN